MRLSIHFLTFIFLGFIFTNCSQQNDNSSDIKINFQSKGVSASSISASDINVIIVNVSGPGIEQNIVVNKNCEDAGVDCSSITIPDVPSGSGRLVQLLMVLKENATTFENAIFYGDSTNDITGETQISLSIKQEDSFATEAKLSGQYVPASGHALAGKFLTGNVEMSVSINGKPDMTLGNKEIFGGWYDIFALDTVKFRYHFTGWDSQGNKYSGVEVFNDIHDGNGLNISTVMNLSSSTNNQIGSFKATTPVKIREDRSGNTFELKQFEQKIFAFLGGSTYHACYDTTTISTFNGSNSSKLCTDQDLTPGDTCDSYLAWTDLTRSLADARAACDSPADAGQWEVDSKNIDDDERFAGFSGVFTSKGTVGNDLIRFTNASNTFSWSADANTAILGFDVFTQVTASFNRDSIKSNGIDDGYDCSKAVSNGFSGPVSATLVGSPAHEYSHGITSTEATAKSSNQFYMLICPKDRDGNYFKTAYLYDGDNSGTSGPPEKAGIRKAEAIDGFSGKLYTNICYPVDVQLEDSGGTAVSSSSAITVNLTDNSGSGNFFQSLGDCEANTTPISSVNINSNAVVFFKTSSTGAAQWSTSSGSLTGSGTFSYSGTASSGVSKLKLIPNFHRKHDELSVATSEECVSFFIGAFKNDGSDDELFKFETATFNLSGAQNSSAATRQFFGTEATCGTGSSPLTTVDPIDSHSLFEVWYKNEDSSTTTISSILNSCAVATCAAPTINIVNPGSYDHFRAGTTAGPILLTSDCIKFDIEAYDNHEKNSFPTNFTNSNAISFSDTGTALGAFFTDPACTASTASVSAPNGQDSKDIYYKASSTGTAQLNFSYDGKTQEVNLTIN